MKKILFFEIPDFSGASRVTRTMAEGLRGEYLVAFATIIPDKDAQDKVSDAIDLHHPDILFCSFIIINPFVVLEGKKRNLTVVIRNDYLLKDIPENICKQAAETYPMADLVIAQTEESRKEIIDVFKLSSDKIIVRNNPINEDEINRQVDGSNNPFPQNGFIHFVWVGRFDPIKNLSMLIKAFSMVHNKIPSTDLYLVGEPDDELLYSIDGVHLVGFQENPFPWIKYADCLLLSSFSETNPNVVQESLYLGTPVISTRYNNEVKEKKNHLISHSNCPESFAEQIINFIKSHLWQISH